MKWFTASADQGNQFAQYSLGKLFLDGKEDLTPNTQQAVKWLTLSADQGNQFAQYSLGKLFLDGKEDLAPSTQQAVKWLTLSADQGNQFAQYSLGKLFLDGKEDLALEHPTGGEMADPFPPIRETTSRSIPLASCSWTVKRIWPRTPNRRLSG